MKCNVGGLDKTGRFLVGAVALAAVVLAPIDTDWRIGLEVDTCKSGAAKF